jgi:homoserine O-succinyltransferase
VSVFAAAPGAPEYGGSGAIEIALVNNMPDGALLSTERQFAALLDADEFDVPIVLRRYTLPAIARRTDAVEHIREQYFPIETLFTRRPAGLIITGCEPHAVDLDSEPYWAELSSLLEWSRREIPSVVASCLAAHAALLHFDGVRRCRLPHKRTGVYTHDVQCAEPLCAGIPARTTLPHSRHNDVPTSMLDADGYRPLIVSGEAGWAVACKEIGDHLLIVMQGHPEYEKDSLLLEFRRDVRRYVRGEMATYPDVPVGYFEASAEPILRRLRAGAMAHRVSSFPTEALGVHIRGTWLRPARQFYANWLAELNRRVSGNPRDAGNPPSLEASISA